MAGAVRSLRRCAYLLSPQPDASPETLDRIRGEGFTDIGLWMRGPWMREQFPGTGFTPATAHEAARRAEERGLGVICFTGYMKYQEEIVRAEPSRAMVTREEGAGPDKPTLWVCPFRPENREGYVAFLLKIAPLPALREIWLNDEAQLVLRGHAIGCYCDWCSDDFEKRAGSRPPAQADWDDPLWWRWIDHRMESWTAVHAELRRRIKEVRPDVAVGIEHNPLHATFSIRPWVSAVSLGRDAREMDTLRSNPYHFLHAHHIVYRPHRRIVAEATRSLAGACLDRRVHVFCQGFAPPMTSHPLTHQDGLLEGIVPFALGAGTITPYAYPLMKIVPGLFEGLQDARRLEAELAKGRPYAFATVVRPLQSELRGHPTTDWGKQYLAEVAEVMYRAGVSYRWVWDERLEDAAGAMEEPLVVPDAHCLTASQLEIVRGVADRGEGILWIGNIPSQPWSGRGACPVPTPFEMGVSELRIAGSSPLVDDLTRPVMLASRVGWSGPEGDVVGTVDGRPALVLTETDGRREAWLTGLPLHTYVPPGMHSANRVPTGGVELLRRLLDWVARREPLVRLDPFPPPNDYRRVRPWDARDVPTMELLPLVDDEGVLAIIFPYLQLAFETSLVICPPTNARVAGAVDLWKGEDLSGRMERDDAGRTRIPLEVPGETELLAIRVELEGA